MGSGRSDRVAAPNRDHDDLMLDSLLPSRSVEDYIDGRVTIVLAGVAYRLRELSMVETDAWAGAIDDRLMGLLAKIDALDNGTVTLATLFEDARLFDGSLFDTLLAYDKDATLPPKETLQATVTHTQVLFALLGVWATTKSPLAVGVLNAVKMALILTGIEQAPTASSPETSDGDSEKSEPDSPTDSSTTTSPSRKNGSPTSTARPSKSRGRATSSRVTATPTVVGSA